MKIEITEPKAWWLIAVSQSKDNQYWNAVLFNISKGEYVVAWNYDIERGTWGQGHYFSSYPNGDVNEARENAMKYYAEHYL